MFHNDFPVVDALVWTVEDERSTFRRTCRSMFKDLRCVFVPVYLGAWPGGAWVPRWAPHVFVVVVFGVLNGKSDLRTFLQTGSY